MSYVLWSVGALRLVTLLVWLKSYLTYDATEEEDSACSVPGPF
jgi:hypothetical protein